MISFLNILPLLLSLVFLFSAVYVFVVYKRRGNRVKTLGFILAAAAAGVFVLWVSGILRWSDIKIRTEFNHGIISKSSVTLVKNTDGTADMYFPVSIYSSHLPKGSFVYILVSSDGGKKYSVMSDAVLSSFIGTYYIFNKVKLGSPADAVSEYHLRAAVSGEIVKKGESFTLDTFPGALIMSRDAVFTAEK
jgi:hypothetical protein